MLLNALREEEFFPAIEDFFLPGKGQENPDFCASGKCGSFLYNPVVGSGTFGNGPVGPEILTFITQQRKE